MTTSRLFCADSDLGEDDQDDVGVGDGVGRGVRDDDEDDENEMNSHRTLRHDHVGHDDVDGAVGTAADVVQTFSFRF